MSSNFKAFWVSEADQAGQVRSLPQDQLGDEGVLIKVEWSSVNYKDALGGLARGKIYKTFPIIGGIDLAGVVAEGAQSGQRVLVNGCGLGEIRHGGYAEWARVPADWIVPLPSGMTSRQAMIFGTAGFTASLAAHRMLVAGQTPDKGPILVTGASGGVGMVAVALMHHLGFEVWGLSGKESSHSLLKSLGAHKVLLPSELPEKVRPLESATWGGAIDNVGGAVLTKVLSATQLWGNVACVGLAESADLRATVMPLILRGVSLLGVSSGNAPAPLRRLLWEKLASDWKAPGFDKIPVQEVDLEGLTGAMKSLLERQHTGRTVVRLRPPKH